jgi:hypothetical protein
VIEIHENLNKKGITYNDIFHDKEIDAQALADYFDAYGINVEKSDSRKVSFSAFSMPWRRDWKKLGFDYNDSPTESSYNVTKGDLTFRIASEPHTDRGYSISMYKGDSANYRFNFDNVITRKQYAISMLINSELSTDEIQDELSQIDIDGDIVDIQVSEK